jgi:hypothetical protein
MGGSRLRVIARRRHASGLAGRTAALVFLAVALVGLRAIADDAPAPGKTKTKPEPHVAAEHEQAIKAPVTGAPAPASTQDQDPRWWAAGDGRVFLPALEYSDAAGSITTLNTTGPTETRGHPFFSPLGGNGRACVTCHQPADGMSLSVESVRARWQATQGKDPLFAAVDGSNCPSLPQAERSSHSLLLERGLLRVFRPWPPKAEDGSAITPQFSIEVMHDPTHCNTDPRYGLHSATPMLSVYRRPRPATNIKYLTAVEFSFEPKTGLPLPRDRETGEPTSGNLMADARNRTLKTQAREAILIHLQARENPSDETLQRIIQFESALYTAQSRDRWRSPLTEAGALGGPQMLADARPGELQSATKNPIWNEFLPWLQPTAAAQTEAQRAFRESVARGAELFVKRTFLIWDSAGVTSMGFGNPVRNSCAFCHNMSRTGLDVAPGQVDLGTTNDPFADAAPELPLFKLTCKDGFPPHPHLGRVVYTHDPGYALTTGKCIDIGKITVQQMRGLSARPPYFSNGSAASLRAVVDFYERRYAIGLTEREKEDLSNLMSVL